ncbi:MAG: FAD-dependent oxidoreductase [Acidimicrobiales bacterium]
MPSNVIVAGAGMAGYAAARALERFGGDELTITVVNPTNAVVYPPVLPEVAGGSVAPRQAVSPLRAGLRRSRLVVGELCGLDRTQRVAAVKLADGTRRELPWDHAVLGFGSITRLLPIDGLTGAALDCRLAEAASLGSGAVIEPDRFATAAGVARRRALTFVVVGGVHRCRRRRRAAAPGEATAAAIRSLGERWHLVEASDTLSVVRASLTWAVAGALRQRKIELHLECTVERIDSTQLSLSDGTVLDAAGSGVVVHRPRRPHRPTGARGPHRRPRPGDRRCLRCGGACPACGRGRWCRLPGRVTRRLCPPSAQYAVRQTMGAQHRPGGAKGDPPSTTALRSPGRKPWSRPGRGGEGVGG